MPFAALPEYKINLLSSWMIGDSEKDMEPSKKRRMPLNKIWLPIADVTGG
jgi:hypothetical protein